MSENYFTQLNAMNVSDHVEQKSGLSYLSWAWAWGELKKLHPDAFYTIYENQNGWFYHTDGRTCWVKTGVTVCGVEHIEYLPVMDYRNKSIPAEAVTSFDVNKAIQRSLTKAVARHGLGLYIYAGEDLPEEQAQGKKQEKEQQHKKQIAGIVSEEPFCPLCGKEVKPIEKKEGTVVPAQQVLETYGMCASCVTEQAAP